MRKTLMTAALVFALCCTALAGEMHTPAAPTPPPTDATQETAEGVTLNGDIHTTAESETLTQTALELLTLLPSLL